MRKIILILLLLMQLPGTAQDAADFIQTLDTDKQKADTLFSLARKDFRKGRFDSVEYWLDKGQFYAKRSGDDETIARYLVERGNMRYMQGKFTEGIALIQKAVPHLAKTDSYDLHNSAYMITGNCFNALQKKDSALYYFRLCEKYNNEKFPYRNWLVYSMMGDLYSGADDYQQAEKYFQKAYDLTAARENRPDHGYLLSVFANFYVSWNKPGEFGRKLNEYNELMSERKKKNGSEPDHNLFLISWTNQDLGNKIQFMNNVKAMSLKAGNFTQVTLANAYIISYYEKAKQYEEALKFALENEKISSDAGSLQNVYASVKVKYGLLKKLGREKEANAAADRLFLLKDSILQVQRRDMLYEMETRFKTEQKEKEIALLTSQHQLSRLQLKTETEKREALQRENILKGEKLAKELLLRQALERENSLIDSSLAKEQRLNEALGRASSLKESELQKEKLLTSALSRENELKQSSINQDKKNKQTLWGGIIMLSLAGGIILFQFNRQVKKNRIIKKQAEEMEVLNREIHHRVKNNLQVISSLLDIQSQTLKDEEAAEVIRESRQRVQSMAFIHQNLYQSTSVQEIELRNYINTLADHLFQSYNIRKDKILFTTDIDPISLHSDTVIPLGMILNELISNSLKYAFKDLENGEIKVTMKQKENELLLRVRDNGKGLPAGFDISKLHSFGFKVIKAFAQKLKAKLLIDGSRGTDVQLVISKFKTI